MDVRNPPQDFSPGSGAKRSGKRLLTVGTDCAVGKKYTVLALEQALLLLHHPNLLPLARL